VKHPLGDAIARHGTSGTHSCWSAGYWRDGGGSAGTAIPRLITQRSKVQIPPPPPLTTRAFATSGGRPSGLPGGGCSCLAHVRRRRTIAEDQAGHRLGRLRVKAGPAGGRLRRPSPRRQRAPVTGRRVTSLNDGPEEYTQTTNVASSSSNQTDRIRRARTHWAKIGLYMNLRSIPYIPVWAGVVCGILSTIPSELRFLPSMLLWGGVGTLIGFFVPGEQNAIQWGLIYGISLLVGFFVSRLAVDTKALHSPLFIALAVILTPMGAVVAVAVGSRSRRLIAPTRNR
jgi:hypothetical protein